VKSLGLNDKPALASNSLSAFAKKGDSTKLGERIIW